MGFGGLRFGHLGVFQSSLVVLLAVKLGGFAVRFGGCAVKFRSLDMMCLRHERISSLEIAPQRTPFGFRSSGAGGAAGSESTHARLNLEYPDRKLRGEPGAHTAILGFGCADEANASAAIPSRVSGGREVTSFPRPPMSPSSTPAPWLKARGRALFISSPQA